MEKINFNKDLGSLVNGAGEKFEGQRISEIVGFQNNNEPKCSEFRANESARWELEDYGTKHHATAYEIVSSSARDTALGQEYLLPNWDAYISAIFYK